MHEVKVGDQTTNVLAIYVVEQTNRRQLVDGTDRGRDARAVVDLLHESADYLQYFRCRARVACPAQLAHLIAAALPDTLWPFVLCRPTSEFQR